MKYLFLLFLIGLISCRGKTQSKDESPIYRVVNDSTLTFSIYSTNSFPIEILNQWDKTASEKIKKINFNNFDTIPIQFGQFSNVESLSMGYLWPKTYLPDIYPKLERIELEMVDLTIAPNARFKQNLKEIEAGKSTIYGIKSFRELPNLEIINIGFSRFDPFPNDLRTLKKLKKLHLGAYNDSLNINDLGLSELQSLKSVIIVSWIKGFSGFPKDIMKIDSKKVKMEIRHNSMTAEQKKMMRRFAKPEY
jgi:hypothetical protein